MTDEQKRVALIDLNGDFLGYAVGGKITTKKDAVLHQLLNILGPTAPACSGCAEEWQAAIDLIKKELE